MMNCGRKVTLKPMNTEHRAEPAPVFSLYIRPVILGHQ